MSLHFIDARIKDAKCTACYGTGLQYDGDTPCLDCSGRGKIAYRECEGKPVSDEKLFTVTHKRLCPCGGDGRILLDAKPEIEVALSGNGLYRWRRKPEGTNESALFGGWSNAKFATKPDALAAAREALS